MPGVIDRPNCANTANKFPPPAGSIGPRTLACVTPDRAWMTAIACPRAGEIPSFSRGSAGHRPPSRCGNQAGRGVQATVSPRRHTARGSLRNPGAIPRCMASTGRAIKTTSSGESRRHVKGSRHRGSNAPDQRGVVGPKRARSSTGGWCQGNPKPIWHQRFHKGKGQNHFINRGGGCYSRRLHFR
jgi:hypothetical protein